MPVQLAGQRRANKNPLRGRTYSCFARAWRSLDIHGRKICTRKLSDVATHIFSYILNSVRFLAALCFRRSLTAQGLSIQPPDDPRPPRDPQNEPVDNSTQTSKYDEAGRWRSRRFFLDVGLGGGVFRTSVYLQRLITVYGTLLILSTPPKARPRSRLRALKAPKRLQNASGKHNRSSRGPETTPKSAQKEERGSVWRSGE